MTLPNFFILGTAKAGTTSLANYLRQHPQVFIPHNKEPNFFILEGCELPHFSGPVDPQTLYEVIYRHSITNIEKYQALFHSVNHETAIGDATVLYLYFPEAADRIQQKIPNARMIVILRNPVDRLYSHYLMVKYQYGLEPLNLKQALTHERERISQNWGWDWHYANVGMYYIQLKYYFDRFDRSQFKIFLYEEYCQNPLKVIQEIFRHIHVDDSFTPDTSKRSKVATMSRNKTIDNLLNHPSRMRSELKQLLPDFAFNRLIRFGNRINRVPYSPMPTDIRIQLQKHFQTDILKLQDLIQQDLSRWLVSSE